MVGWALSMRLAIAAVQVIRVVCGCVLLCFFLWTAHVVWWVPWSVARYVIAPPDWVMGLEATYPRVDTLLVVDFLCLSLLSAMLLTTFVLNYRRGKAFGILKVVQVGSFMMMLLGLIILTIDPNELWIFMTMFQDETGFALWYTNGADLVVSSCLFVLSSLVVRRSSVSRSFRGLGL